MKSILTILFIMLIAINVSAQFKYLGTFNGDGVPDYLIGTDEVPQKFLADIGASLPEGFPVPTYNPQYISSGYDTNIRLLDSAAVFVSFVGEGAGYRNVLGFYTYDLDNPYTSVPPQDEITIIFPNVSALNSGGGLISGNRVKIGDFPANTGIGWVLIADGWKGGQVTLGNWVLFSNPDFNPESEASDRFHNVLLKDSENELIVLGFEDIRRDYQSCDQDFNDALFYITANPYTAIAKENFVELIEAENVVTSGNEGGLESDGTLASKLAKRNFRRVKSGNLEASRTNQPNLEGFQYRLESANYLPATGFTGKESAHVSSPEDLVELTNAKEIFSVDYYLDNKRVAAAMSIKTEGTVYNHTKNICDRFNGSSVEDVRYVTLNGIKLVYSKIKRADGQIEFATWFSVSDKPNNFNISSLWNIADYPADDYMNFQMWGANPSQLFHIVSRVLEGFDSEKNLGQNLEKHMIPGVYVRKGTYRTGSLELELINQTGERAISLASETRETEFSEPVFDQLNITLSGERSEKVIVAVDKLFDIGFSIAAHGSESHDAMYLSDGSWGVESDDASIDFFEVEQNNLLYDGVMIERNFELKGVNSGVLNVYRNLSYVQRMVDLSAFASIRMKIKNDQPIELSLVDENLEDWDKRYTYLIPAHDEYHEIELSLQAFRGLENGQLKHLKSLIFSALFDHQRSQKINFGVKDIYFSKEQIVLHSDEETTGGMPNVFPNPATDRITIAMPESTRETIISIYDLSGKMKFKKAIDTSLRNEIVLQLNTEPGYYVIVMTQNGKRYQKKILVGK